MTGLLVVNHFLRGEKFDTLHSHLVKTAEDMGIDLKIVTNLDVMLGDVSADFALFWDKDINCAKMLENKGISVFNSADSIALCDDKALTYLALENAVKQPKTIIAPLSFFDVDYRTFLLGVVDKIGTPFVLKECKGSFGEQVWLCNSVDEALEHISNKPFIVQEYIECGNRDIRLEVVGGRVVASMQRYNPNDFRSNITNGGTAVSYTPSDVEIALAIKACDTLGLDFGGVDIIGDMVCEVNSNAHIINIMNTTGVDVAKEIFDYIIKSVK